jgi:hypothetical protein
LVNRFRNNKLTYLRGRLLQTMLELTELDLSSNKLISLSSINLRGLLELTEFIIEKYQLSKIEQGTFSDLIRKVN